MTQPRRMTSEEARAALDAGKGLHLDKDGYIVGIVGEMDVPQPELDIRDEAGWADMKIDYDQHMNAAEYDLAAEYAHEWLMISGDTAFWSPLIETANRALRERHRPEDLAPMRDDPDDMDWLRDPPDDCF